METLKCSKCGGELVKISETAASCKTCGQTYALKIDTVSQKDDTYNRAYHLMTNVKTVMAYKEAANLFNSISDYKDSATLVQMCIERVDTLNKAEVQEQANNTEANHYYKVSSGEKSLHKEKKSGKKAILVVVIIFLVIILLAAAGAAFYIWGMPSLKYNKAVGLMDAGEYDEAIGVFETLEDYNDSVEKISECRYRKAVSLKENGDYEEAFKLFRELGDYGDSREQIADFIVICEKKIVTDNLGGKSTYRYTYDENGNLLKEVYPDSHSIEYSYDENGVLSEKTERFGDSSTQYCYNIHGDVTKETHTYLDGTVSVTEYKHTYDEDGNILRLEETDSDGGVAVTEYDYDKYGNVLKITEIFATGESISKEYTYTYDENGNVLKCVYPETDESYNSIDSIEYTYYENGNLQTEKVTMRSKYVHLYEYDENGNVLKETAMDRTGYVDSTIEYTYDVNGSLLKLNKENASGGGCVSEYTYDEFGNILSIMTQVNYGDKETTTYEYSGIRVFLKEND